MALLTVRRAAEVRVCRQQGRAAVREGSDRRGSSGEEMVQEVSRVGDVDSVIAIHVRCRSAGTGGSAREQIIERKDRIRDVDVLIAVGISPKERDVAHDVLDHEGAVHKDDVDLLPTGRNHDVDRLALLPPVSDHARNC